jgi:hypothetical protein
MRDVTEKQTVAGAIGGYETSPNFRVVEFGGEVGERRKAP